MVTLVSSVAVTMTAGRVVVGVVGSVVGSGLHGVLGAGVVGELQEPLLEGHVQGAYSSLLVPAKLNFSVLGRDKFF